MGEKVKPQPIGDRDISETTIGTVSDFFLPHVIEFYENPENVKACEKAMKQREKDNQKAA